MVATFTPRIKDCRLTVSQTWTKKKCTPQLISEDVKRKEDCLPKKAEDEEEESLKTAPRCEVDEARETRVHISLVPALSL